MSDKKDLTNKNNGFDSSIKKIDILLMVCDYLKKNVDALPNLDDRKKIESTLKDTINWIGTTKIKMKSGLLLDSIKSLMTTHTYLTTLHNIVFVICSEGPELGEAGFEMYKQLWDTEMKLMERWNELIDGVIAVLEEEKRKNDEYVELLKKQISDVEKLRFG